MLQHLHACLAYFDFLGLSCDSVSVSSPAIAHWMDSAHQHQSTNTNWQARSICLSFLFRSALYIVFFTITIRCILMSTFLSYDMSYSFSPTMIFTPKHQMVSLFGSAAVLNSLFFVVQIPPMPFWYLILSRAIINRTETLVAFSLLPPMTLFCLWRIARCRAVLILARKYTPSPLLWLLWLLI